MSGSGDVGVADAPLVYSSRVLITNLVLSFFFAVITAGAGVIIPLRAETAQEAQQTLLAAIMVPGIVLGMVPPVLFSLRPQWRGGDPRDPGQRGVRSGDVDCRGGVQCGCSGADRGCHEAIPARGVDLLRPRSAAPHNPRSGV